MKRITLKDESILAIGMISLALALLVGQFLQFEVEGFAASNFIEGILIGLSLVMNCTYLIKKGRKIKKNRSAAPIL